MAREAMDRRAFLKIGAGAASIALAGCSSEPDERRQGAAYAPWTLWDDAGVRGTPLALVSAAILAANPHNTQPWLFRISNEAIEVFADLSRHLGAMDPFVREMHLGIGCALENAVLAAAANGYAVTVDPAPGSLLGVTRRSCATPVATLHLARRSALAVDPLHRAIPLRHTNRGAYLRDASIAPEWLAAARAYDGREDIRVMLLDGGEHRAAFDAATIDATKAIIADEVMIADSDVWFRDSATQIDLHRDGPSLETAGLSGIKLALARVLPISPESAHAGWLSQTTMQLETAPLAGLIVVRDRFDRPTALRAGRAWQRLHLTAVTHGVALQPMNQAIEMIDRECQRGNGTGFTDRLAALTGPDWTATFAFRAGRPGSKAPPAARRALSAVIEA